MSRSSGRTSSRPELLIDRSLGLRAVPDALRRVGYRVFTLDDIFGARPVEDVEWIRFADARGMAAACKDGKIRRRPLEKHALYYSTLRVLCLTDGHLRADQQAERFVANIELIDALWRREGPWVYAVHERRLERLQLYAPE